MFDVSVQAFCHWTYHQSGGEYLFCDAQGIRKLNKYILTDPCILSNKEGGGVYGVADVGRKYLLNWFLNHKCSKHSHCDRDWLKPSEDELKSVPQSVRKQTSKHSSYLNEKSTKVRTLDNQFDIKSGVNYMKSLTSITEASEISEVKTNSDDISVSSRNNHNSNENNTDRKLKRHINLNYGNNYNDTISNPTDVDINNVDETLMSKLMKQHNNTYHNNNNSISKSNSIWDHFCSNYLTSNSKTLLSDK